MSLTSKIDVLNIGMMVAALVVAFQLPFELVLVSYAILGPLHYLTEISWLHDRSYFTNRKLDFVLLALAAAAIAGLMFFTESSIEKEARTAQLTLLAMGGALLFVVTRTNTARIFGFLALGLAMIIVSDAGYTSTAAYNHFYLIAVPTVVHICVFTGAFILFGALKAKSKTGYAAFAVFVACIVASLVVPASVHTVGESTRRDYGEGFGLLSQYLVYNLGIGVDRGLGMFDQPAFVLVARFLAFAYTYHYLNWFSKTKIIRWHEVPRWRFVLVGVVWAASLGTYAYDFKTGFQWLLFLSLLHVFLEFPLNVRSFSGIGKELAGRLRPASAA